MKLPLALLLLLALVVGYYQACAVPAAERRGRQDAMAARAMDSLVTAAQYAAERERVRDSARRVYLARDTVAAREVATLEHQLGVLRDTSVGLVARLDSLLETIPDTARAAVTAAVRVLTARADLCETALGMQQDRLTACQAIEARGDSVARLVPSLRAAVDSAVRMAERWQARARDAGRPWALTVGLGPGMFWTPGDSLVRFGIGATVQVSYRILRLPPW